MKIYVLKIEKITNIDVSKKEKTTLIKATAFEDGMQIFECECWTESAAIKKTADYLADICQL